VLFFSSSRAICEVNRAEALFHCRDGQVYGRRLGGVFHHGLDAVLAGALGLVALTGADHLAVGGRQVEQELPTARLAREAGVDRRIALDECDAAYRRWVRLF